MPRLEVLGREAVDNQNNLATQRREQQDMLSNAEFKVHQAESQAIQAKAMAKNADSEEAKAQLMKIAQDHTLAASLLSHWLEYSLVKNPDGSEGVDPNKWNQARMNGTKSLMENPAMHGVIDAMSAYSTQAPSTPSPEDELKTAQAQHFLAGANYMQASANDLNGVQPGAQPNAPAISALNGSMPSPVGGAMPSAPVAAPVAAPAPMVAPSAVQASPRVRTGVSYGPTGATINYGYPDAEAQVAAAKAAGTKAGEPYTENEANSIGLGETLRPTFDALKSAITKLPGGTKIDDKRFGWFGGAKINAATERGPGQSIMTMAESPLQREIALQLNKVKQVAFAYGGKTLSETERQLVFSALSPVNKTPKQWIDDLDWAQKRIEKAHALMTQPRGFSNTNSGKTMIGKYELVTGQ